MSAINHRLIGTSDFPVFVPGAAKYSSKSDLWLRCVRGVQPHRDDWLRVAGRAGQLDERQTARLLLEEVFGTPEEDSDAALTKIEQRTGVPGRPWQRYHGGDFVAQLGPRAVGSTGIARQVAIIECKSRSGWAVKQWGLDGSDEVAADVYAQVQGQLEAIRHDRDHWVGTDLPDLDVIHVAVRVDGYQIRHFVVGRDPELGALLVDAAAQFWTDHVLTERPPDPDGSDGADIELEERFAAYTDRVRAPAPGELEVLKRIRGIRKTLAEIKEEQDAFLREERIELQRLKSAIGSDLGLEIENDVRVVWRDVKGRLKSRGLIDELAGRLGLSKAQLTEIEDRHRGQTRREIRVSFTD